MHHRQIWENETLYEKQYMHHRLSRPVQEYCSNPTHADKSHRQYTEQKTAYTLQKNQINL